MHPHLNMIGKTLNGAVAELKNIYLKYWLIFY